jgi:DNA-binding response OmpR family regulator
MDGKPPYPANRENRAEEPPRILVVDDDAEMRSLLAVALTEEGYVVEERVDGYEFVEALAHAVEEGQEDKYRLIIADVRMPGYSGLDVLVASRRLLDRIPVIVVSAYLDEAARRLALFLHARVVLQKPLDLDELRATVARLIEHPDPDSAENDAAAD